MISKKNKLLDDIASLQKIIDKSKNIVFFGGAGVSTESGIPDFRSVDGLYNMKWAYPPEQIISRTFFYENTKEFYRFYREKLLIKGVEPNAAHYKLAELEKAGKLKAVVTQNIDGLHQKAGSKTVYELHGSVLRNYCEYCHAFYDEKIIEESANALTSCLTVQRKAAEGLLSRTLFFTKRVLITTPSTIRLWQLKMPTP